MNKILIILGVLTGNISAIPVMSSPTQTNDKEPVSIEKIQEQQTSAQPLSEEHNYYKQERDAHKNDGGTVYLETAQKLNEKLLLDAVRNKDANRIQEYLKYDPRPCHEIVLQAYMIAKEEGHAPLAKYLKEQLGQYPLQTLLPAEAEIEIGKELIVSKKVSTSAKAEKIAAEIVKAYPGKTIKREEIPTLINNYFSKLSLFQKIKLK